MIRKLFTYNVIIQLIGFFTSILAARFLGPEGRGELALVLLYPQLAANLVLSGMERGFAISVGKKEIFKVYDLVFIFSFIFSLIAYSIFYFLATQNITDENLFNLSLSYSIYIPLLFVFMFTLSIQQGKGDFDNYNKLRLLYYFSYILLLLIGVFSIKYKLEVFVYANLLSSVFVFLFSVYLLKDNIVEEDKILLKDRILLVLKNSYIFIIPTIIFTVVSRIDQYMIVKYLNSADLGLFVVFLGVSRLISPLANAFNIYMFHKSISMNSDFNKIIKQSVLLYFILITGMYFFAKYIVYILYGEDYIKDIDSLQVLIISSFFYFTTQLISEYFKGQKIVNIDIYANIAFFIVIILSFFVYKYFFGTSLLVFCYAFLSAEVVRMSIFIMKVRMSWIKK